MASNSKLQPTSGAVSANLRSTADCLRHSVMRWCQRARASGHQAPLAADTQHVNLLEDRSACGWKPSLEPSSTIWASEAVSGPNVTETATLRPARRSRHEM